MFERKLVDDKSRITALTLFEGQLSCQGFFDLPVPLFILPLTLQSEPFFQNIFSFGMAVEGIYTQDCAR